MDHLKDAPWPIAPRSQATSTPCSRRAAFADYGPNGLQVEGRARGRQDRLRRHRKPRADRGGARRGGRCDPGPPRPVLAGPGRSRDRLDEGRGSRACWPRDMNLFAYHLPLDAHAELGNNAQFGTRLRLVADARFGDQDLGFIGTVAQPLTPAGLAALLQFAAGSRAGGGRGRRPPDAGASRGAPAARRAISKLRSRPAPTPSSPARSPSRRRTARARPASPSLPAATTRANGSARRGRRRMSRSGSASRTSSSTMDNPA